MRNSNFKSKKIFQRVCKRCGCIFYIRARLGKFCKYCYQGNSKKKERLFEGLDNYPKNKNKFKECALNHKSKAFCKEVEA